MSFLFKSFLESLPSSRSELVSALEIPADVLDRAPYKLREEDSVGSAASLDGGSVDTASDISLSRAVTDSDIDYDIYKRFQSRHLCDPWEELSRTLAAFPADHLASLASCYSDTAEEDLGDTYERELVDDTLRKSMERFFEEECLVFLPNDPSLSDLEEALSSVDPEVSVKCML